MLARNDWNRGKLKKRIVETIKLGSSIELEERLIIRLFWPCKMITLVVCRKIGKRKEKKVSIFCSIGGRVYGSRSNRDIRSLWNFMLTYGTCIFHGFIIISHLGLRNAKFLEWAFYRFCRSEIRARSANNKSNIRVTGTYFVSRHTLNTVCLYISKKES